MEEFEAYIGSSGNRGLYKNSDGEWIRVVDGVEEKLSNEEAEEIWFRVTGFKSNEFD